MGGKHGNAVAKSQKSAQAEAAIARAEAALQAQTQTFRQKAHDRLAIWLAENGMPARLTHGPSESRRDWLSPSSPSQATYGLAGLAEVSVPSWQGFAPSPAIPLGDRKSQDDALAALLSLLQDLKEQAGSYGLGLVSHMADALKHALSRPYPLSGEEREICHDALCRLIALLQAEDAPKLTRPDREILLRLKRLART